MATVVIRNYPYSVQGERKTFKLVSPGTSPYNKGLLLKERICSPRSKFFPLTAAPNFQAIQLAMLKRRVKINFWIHEKGMENCKMSGKIQGILHLRISGNPVPYIDFVPPVEYSISILSVAF